MLETLERLVSILKTLLWYIIAPISAVIGLVLLLKSNKERLKNTAGLDTKVIENLVKDEEEKNEAKKADGDYITTRDEYLRKHSVSEDPQ